jgi:transcriptional regulator with XRE-family HTH domain
MNRITLLRKEKGMSQIALSLQLNLSQKMISSYETGKNEPSLSTLERMADIFDTSIDYIIGYTDIRQPLDKINQVSLSADECTLLNKFRTLTEKQKQIALGVLIGFNAENEIN